MIVRVLLILTLEVRPLKLVVLRWSLARSYSLILILIRRVITQTLQTAVAVPVQTMMVFVSLVVKVSQIISLRSTQMTALTSLPT